MDVIIVGAGGHGQVVADILQQAYENGGKYKPIGFVDDALDKSDCYILGLPILGAVKQINQFQHDAIVIAIGNNKIRAKLWQRFTKENKLFVNAIHPSTIIAPDVKIGLGTVICAGVIINTGTKIGNNAILNTGCTIDHHNQINDHVHIAPGCHLGGAILVEQGGFVGIGSAILPNIHIAQWSIVGGGSLVNRDVAKLTTVVGVPAKPL